MRWKILAVGLLLASPAAADMYQDASNAKLPEAANNLGAASGTHYANAYGNCTWNAASDVSPCIMAAIAAAQAATHGGSTAGLIITGGKVILPPGEFGIASTILQNQRDVTLLQGAGGPGAYGSCKTALRWIGASGGTMVQFGSDTTPTSIGGGLEGICLLGGAATVGTGAGIGLKLRSASHGVYRDFFIDAVQTHGIDIDVSPHASATGTARNNFERGQIGLASLGAKAANGVWIGDGTVPNDTWGNTFRMVTVQYQDGIAWRCGGADTNIFTDVWGQNIGDPLTAGRSLVITGPNAIPNDGCYENRFDGAFGLSNVVRAAPLIEANSFHNELVQNARRSGSQIPVVDPTASFKWQTDDGLFNDSRSNAQGFVYGKMSYLPNGSHVGVFDIDVENTSNFASAAKFGPRLPIYVQYAQPGFGFNAYYQGGNKYGKGSAAAYGGYLNFDTTTGLTRFITSTTAGDADAAIPTMGTVFNRDRFGHDRVSNLAAPALTGCGTSPIISGDDRAGIVIMGTGSPTTCTLTFANAYAAQPYCTVTWQQNLAFMGYQITASTLVVSQTATSSNAINYHCTARAGG